MLQGTWAALRTAIVAGVLAVALPARAEDATVRPAADGVFAAFEQHALVGLGDAHGLAEEGEFYAQLVSDPRFAAKVGHVVMEAASSTHQTTLDRYLDGRRVPRDELRKVWSDTIGWVTPPSQMYAQFLDAVRAVNSRLPAERRIRVWAGGPPADWSVIKTREQFFPLLTQRDSFPADLIEREILARGRKALVIYGALHFYPLPARPGATAEPGIRGRIERTHPDAFYIVQPYYGFVEAGCSSAFEAETRWPPASLVAPVKGSLVEALLLRPGCSVSPAPRRAPGATPIPAEELTRLQAAFGRRSSGAEADALLYLGPAAGLSRSLDDPDLARDPAYAAEIQRRMAITGGPPDFLNRLVTSKRPYRDPTAAPQ